MFCGKMGTFINKDPLSHSVNVKAEGITTVELRNNFYFPLPWDISLMLLLMVTLSDDFQSMTWNQLPYW